MSELLVGSLAIRLGRVGMTGRPAGVDTTTSACSSTWTKRASRSPVPVVTPRLFRQFRSDLKAYGDRADWIRTLSMDMSRPVFGIAHRASHLRAPQC